jgi:AsmA protein
MQRSGAAAPLLDALRNRHSPDVVRSVIERLTGAARPAPPPADAPAKVEADSGAEAVQSTGPARANGAEPAPKDPR